MRVCLLNEPTTRFYVACYLLGYDAVTTGMAADLVSSQGFLSELPRNKRLVAVQRIAPVLYAKLQELHCDVMGVKCGYMFRDDFNTDDLVYIPGQGEREYNAVCIEIQKAYRAILDKDETIRTNEKRLWKTTVWKIMREDVKRMLGVPCEMDA